MFVGVVCRSIEVLEETCEKWGDVICFVVPWLSVVNERRLIEILSIENGEVKFGTAGR